MPKIHIQLGICFVCCFSGASAATVKSAKVVAVTLDTSRKPAPRYQHGHFVTRDFPLVKAVGVNAAGKSFATKHVDLEGSPGPAVDVAVAPDGTVAMAASVKSGGGHIQPIIVWFTSSGDPLRIVSTGNYASRRLSFSADGTLWTLGRQYDSSLRDLPEYDLLRQYDSSGKLIRSLLPRTSLPGPRDETPFSNAFLAVSGDHVGLFSTEAKQWVRLSAIRGAVVDTGTVPSLPRAQITGIAMSPNAPEFFVTTQTDNGRNVITALYRLNRATVQFEEVDTTRIRSASEQVTLLGLDEAQLVLRVKPGASVYWVTVEEDTAVRR